MATMIEKLPNEPIIILKYQGMLTVESIQTAFAETHQLMQTHRLTQVYRISDMLEAEYPNFGEIRRLFAWLNNQPKGSSADSRIYGVFVGNNHFLRAYASFIRILILNTRAIPHFDTLEDALNYIRTDPKKIIKLP